MKERVKGLLQQINFIETDMELQKQILFSIPSDQKGEMEKVLEKISSQKQQIQDLRRKIEEVDPEEYRRILAIEQASEKFRTLAAEKKFEKVHTLNEEGECFITLNDGTRLDCLVAAKDDQGSWTVLTLEGEAKEYSGEQIRE
ncbi:MAG: hypothetical protein HUN04_18400 [Desulfobacter sp.]|nr:MAG: hypothetical protein HUN04_18400 [Desulfobacter sp.]